jgi:hypothetical protein
MHLYRLSLSTFQAKYLKLKKKEIKVQKLGYMIR